MELKNSYSDNVELIEFWENLLPVYEYFETHRKLIEVKFNAEGKYLIN